MTLNIRRLVPIASGALIFLVSGCEETQLSHNLQEGESDSLGLVDYGAILGQTPAVEAATLPDPNRLYNAAVALGGDAQQTADRARSVTDWERAAMGWERALNFLRAIPKGSPMHRAAQAKIYDYERRLDNAMGRLRASNDEAVPTVAMANEAPASISSQHGISYRNAPGTHRTARAAVSAADCQVAAPGSADILLSDLQLEAYGGEDLLTGCITNRTNQPISAIALTYSHTDGEAASGRFQVPLSLNQESLAPGETRAFQQSYGIEPQVEAVVLESANWDLGNGPQAQRQEAELDVTVTRE